MHFFNTTGPCRPEWHYMIPALTRLNEQANIIRLIKQRAYFVMHAPRQMGKTTAMRELAQNLTDSGEYTAVLVSMEAGSPFSDRVDVAEKAILADWQNAISSQIPSELQPSQMPSSFEEGIGISSFLTQWCRISPRPVVIFLDEIDALQNETLLSVLRQLRSGFDRRPNNFPSSVALIGLRDVRDYKIASGGKDRLVSPSPFNIAVRSLTLRNFNVQEVSQLLLQHTKETGQLFTEEALQLVFEFSQGQPWLVNALAKLCVEEMEEDVTKPITVDHVRQAKELLIQRRQTHLDQLTDKLGEKRVRSVIEPMLAGETLEDVPLDDREYVIDLGLVTRRNGGTLTISNPIYQEIIPRVLASGAQDSLPAIYPVWLNKDGSLNAKKLLDSFLEFWRQHGEPLLRSTSYHEIAPHLVMMAFLQRVCNGEGTLTREYAIGSGRIDLLLEYRQTRLAIELKVWRAGKIDPVTRGLLQLDDYLTGLGLEEGWLVIFDQRRGKTKIGEQLTVESLTSPFGRAVTLIYA